MSDKQRMDAGSSPFGDELEQFDPIIDRLIKLEEERQVRRLILIPSESICHPLVRRTMESVYTNLYAEGYPSSLATFLTEEELSDLPKQLVSYRRYADRRFYKGTDYVNIVESICRRRAADAFANEKVDSSRIFANVQALSGAAANLAVQEAFLEPGDTMMCMDLMHGGHLSHGSEFHMSGRRYHIVSYGISRRSNQLDYDEIGKLAMEHRPRMIIAGYTSYPFAPDWERFREIADSCGAVLLADVAHPAGMVIAGAYPNPVGIADVITMTTHKTLMGPRGALILTTDEEKARMVDNAVFPGEQGGPHINTITALAVALKIAQTDAFKKLQRDIVANATYFAGALEQAGLSLAYGGTDTHLLLIDLKKLPKVTGETLSGEIAVRLLELCGVVANKNTIPGDSLTAMASGVRMGTPWLTQRGISKEQLSSLARSISKLLHAVHPFHYEGVTGTLPRGKVDFAVMEEVKEEIAALAEELTGEAPQRSGYPHYSFCASRSDEEANEACEEAKSAAENTAALFEMPGAIIRVTGERVDAHMQNLVTADLGELLPGRALRTLMLDGEGKVLDDVVVIRLSPADDGRAGGFFVLPNPERSHTILAWMRGHADGYLLFEPGDITAKVEGPVVVEDLSEANDNAGDHYRLLELRGEKATDLCGECGNNTITFELPEERTALLLIPVSAFETVYQGLLSCGAVLCTSESRAVLRSYARLPAHPIEVSELLKANQTHWFAVAKPYFVGQRLVKDAFVPASPREPFCWTPPESDGYKRTSLYETHARLTKKLVPFAGWEMPVWYTSTMEEHRAVRQSMALFDVSHMGVFEISGHNATDFLDLVSTNYARWVGDGESYYSFLLDIDGEVIDDIMVYRLRHDRYLVVVNAGNEEEDWAWLNAVNEGRVLIDRENPLRRVLRPARLRDIKEQSAGEDCRVNIALQGPKSRKLLMKLVYESQRDCLMALKRTGCGEFSLADLPVILSRTGYTGESMGFEIFVHPARAPQLWDRLLKEGEAMGLIPAGLGARDSLRTEAGLPLYGHELAGPYAITPQGACFPSYVKFHKPFFIGKQALLKKEAERDKIIVRFKVSEKGSKPLKPGDPLANARGAFIGKVTSCAVGLDGLQVGLTYVEIKAAKPGRIMVFPLPPEDRRKGLVSPLELEEKAKTLLPVAAEIVDRFPEKPTPKDLVRTESQIAIESID